MGVKKMFKIQNKLYDLWEIRSFEVDQEYNEDLEQLQYLILMNRNSISTNFPDVRFTFDTEEERDAEMKKIMDAFDESEDVLIISN